MADIPVPVPKTPPEAYDTDRAVSSLLISQIQRLQQVVLEQIQTEGQAAEYIKELTARVWAAQPQVEPKRFGAPIARKTRARKTLKKAAARKARRATKAREAQRAPKASKAKTAAGIRKSPRRSKRTRNTR